MRVFCERVQMKLRELFNSWKNITNIIIKAQGEKCFCEGVEISTFSVYAGDDGNSSARKTTPEWMWCRVSSANYPVLQGC